MSMTSIRLNRWGKIAFGWCPVPVRCPVCGSRRTGATKYKDGEVYVECEGCYTVIAGPLEERDA